MIDLITNKICIEGYCLVKPHYVYFIVPLFLILMIFTWITFVKFKKDEEKKVFVKEHRVIRIIFIILRSMVFLLLLIAIASPYKIRETTTEGSPSLTILTDNSSSFEVFDNSIAVDTEATAKIIRESLGNVIPIYDLLLDPAIPRVMRSEFVDTGSPGSHVNKTCQTKEAELIYKMLYGELKKVGDSQISKLKGGSTARPSSPIVGQLYYDSGLGKTILYNGTLWVNVDGSSL